MLGSSRSAQSPRSGFCVAPPEVTAAVRAERSCDACYLTRAAHVTDDIGIHELQWCDDELWFVNTRFSCLCTLHDTFSFVPRWTPKFISRLAAEDRCHLNGLCVSDTLPRYVTALAETDVLSGWRNVKATGGCLIDVVTGETVARGFCMPHSPRLYGGRLWLLDSGEGRLLLVDPETGAREIVTRQPGYLRGLDFAGHYAFIGLSRIRETSVFGGIPIAEKRDELKCAVVVVDLRNGNRVAYFEFLSGVEELFDVRRGSRSPQPTRVRAMGCGRGRGAHLVCPGQRFDRDAPGNRLWKPDSTGAGCVHKYSDRYVKPRGDPAAAGTH